MTRVNISGFQSFVRDNNIYFRRCINETQNVKRALEEIRNDDANNGVSFQKSKGYIKSNYQPALDACVEVYNAFIDLNDRAVNEFRAVMGGYSILDTAKIPQILKKIESLDAQINALKGSTYFGAYQQIRKLQAQIPPLRKEIEQINKIIPVDVKYTNEYGALLGKTRLLESMVEAIQEWPGDTSNIYDVMYGSDKDRVGLNELDGIELIQLKQMLGYDENSAVFNMPYDAFVAYINSIPYAKERQELLDIANGYMPYFDPETGKWTVNKAKNLGLNGKWCAMFLTKIISEDDAMADKFENVIKYMNTAATANWLKLAANGKITFKEDGEKTTEDIALNFYHGAYYANKYKKSEHNHEQGAKYIAPIGSILFMDYDSNPARNGGKYRGNATGGTGVDHVEMITGYKYDEKGNITHYITSGGNTNSKTLNKKVGTNIRGQIAQQLEVKIDSRTIIGTADLFGT